MGNNIFDYKKIVAEELKGAADALFYLGFNQQMFFYNQIAKKNGDRLYFFKDYSDDIIEKINNCFFYSVFLSEIANKINSGLSIEEITSDSAREIDRSTVAYPSLLCFPRTEDLNQTTYNLFVKSYIDNVFEFPRICIRILRELEYKDFLNTTYWKAVSFYVKEKAGCCELCGSKEGLQVHHKSYKNLGNEVKNLQDLQCLCKNCHAKVHQEKSK